MPSTVGLRFDEGDRVVSRISGRHGVVVHRYGRRADYQVHLDGDDSDSDTVLNDNNLEAE
jgi:hypothetical protein